MLMKQVILLFIGLIVGLLSYCQSLLPDVIASSGGNGQNDQVSLNWTIGEPIITTFLNSGNSLTQGFQQGSLTLSTGINKLGLNIEVTVFPNPTTGKLNIKIIDKPGSLWNIEIYDLSGILLYNEKITANACNVDFSYFPPSPYILKISDDSDNYKTYNIIKQ